MKNKQKSWIQRIWTKRSIAMILIVSMLFPYLVYADDTKPENDFYRYLDATEQKTDESGCNLMGNTPEILGLGGFYAKQGEWAFYPDSKNNYGLTAENTVTHEKVQITDFLVANINVIGDSLLFTDVEMTIEEGIELYGTTTRMIYGGNLYRVDGILSLSENNNMTPRQIGEAGKTYYQVTMDQENIFALVGSTKAGAEDWTYCRMDGMGLVEGTISGGEGETIVNSAESNGYLYLEIQKFAENGMNGGYILRIDRDHGTKAVDYIWGYNLRVYGDSIFFLGIEDGYLYETRGTVISCCRIRNFEVNDNGLISGVCENGNTNIVITKEEGLYPFKYCAVKQVGEWYNYLQRQQLEDPIKESNSKNKVKIIEPGAGGGPGGEPGDKSDEPDNKKTPGTNPIKDIELPIVEIPKASVTPEMAVHMIYTLIKGGSISDPIFDVYNEHQKEEFIKFYNNGEMSNVSDYGKYLTDEITSSIGRQGLSDGQIADISKIAHGWLESITYTCETLSHSEKEEEAYVRVHVTKFCDMDNVEISDENMMGYLNGFMEENGYTMSDLKAMGENQLLYEITMYTLQRMQIVTDVDNTFDVLCHTHDELGWVLELGNEPAKGVEQIMEPKNGATTSTTGEGIKNPQPTKEASDGIETDNLKNNKGLPTANNGCCPCVPRQYIFVRKVHDTENLSQYILRQIKNQMIDMRFDVPLTDREQMKKNEENKYRIYDDYKKVDTSEYLPGVIICKDLYLDNLQHEPGSFIGNLRDTIRNWFIGKRGYITI